MGNNTHWRLKIGSDCILHVTAIGKILELGIPSMLSKFSVVQNRVPWQLLQIRASVSLWLAHLPQNILLYPHSKVVPVLNLWYHHLDPRLDLWTTTAASRQQSWFFFGLWMTFLSEEPSLMTSGVVFKWLVLFPSEPKFYKTIIGSLFSQWIET